MKTLIVGGTSSLGSALKPVLSEFSEVITAGRKSCDVRLDLSDPSEAIVLPDGIDSVIHTAAHFGGNKANEILEAENLNVLGTLKLCQAAVRAKVTHFVLISSMFACLKEGSEFYSIYALSKRHAEDVARFFCSAHFLPLAILRPSQIYGSNDRFRRHQPIIYVMMEKARLGEDIQIYGSHDARRNYIYIDDLTALVSRTVKNRVVGTYSCQHPVDVTYSQIARASFAAFKRNGSVRFVKDKQNIADNVFERDEALYKLTGFYPQTSIEDGLRKIAEEL